MTPGANPKVPHSRLSALAAVLILTGCATGHDGRVQGARTGVIPKSGTQKIDEVITAVEKKIDAKEKKKAVDKEAEDEVDKSISHDQPKKPRIALELNEKVEKWIDYFSEKNREQFARFMRRGEKYKPMITAVLKEQGIPTELYYQAMIESGFRTSARSHAGAVGIWQFIRATGKRYGLRVGRYVDERRDPMRATIAAAMYLKDLHNVFQSWYLAMAAYNAGEMRITGAIMRGKTRDFWELVEQRVLPSETMNYIPKFLAATTIGHDPEKYGYDSISESIMPKLASVTVPSPVDLDDFAKATDIPLDAVKEYNPHILKGMTPRNVDEYRLWVPKDMTEQVEAKHDKLVALRDAKVKQLKRLARKRSRYHRVRRGENLTLIARRYGTSIASIKRLNGMRSARIYPGQLIKVSGGGSGRYRVRSGDNLHLIARKFETSVRRLKQLNDLNGSRIYPGQVLHVDQYSRYKVRRGDNLSTIARKFGVSVRHLKRVNRLNRDTIYAGQVLKVGNHRG